MIDEIVLCWADLAAHVMRQALVDLASLEANLEPELADDLCAWFSSHSDEAFSFRSICIFTGADPEAFLAKLPVLGQVLARRYTPGYLRDQRRRLGLTQAQLADRLGVDRNFLKQWEEGRRPIPDRFLPGMEAVFFPPGDCRGCGGKLERIASGGLVCRACSQREDDDLYCRGLDRGEWSGAIFRRRKAG